MRGTVEDDGISSEVEPLVSCVLMVDGEVNLGALVGVRVSRGNDTTLEGAKVCVTGEFYSNVSGWPVGRVWVN